MNQALAPLDPGMIKLHRTGTGTPLVLLHCLGVDHGLWNIAAAGLEQSHTILSYDFPGHHEAKLAPRPFTPLLEHPVFPTSHPPRPHSITKPT